MAEFEQHLTIEQLSASLDKQLSADEQEYAQKHLPTCEQCQQQQAELRQTAALLHALPQPALPRSFALPPHIFLAEPATIPETKPDRLHTRVAPSTQRTFWSPYLHTAIRVASAFAAVIGIVFLLSSLLPLLTFHTEEATSTTRSAAMPPAQANNMPDNIDVTQAIMSPQALTQTPLSTPPEASPAQTQVSSGQVQATPSQFQPTPAQRYQPLQPGIRHIATPTTTPLLDFSTLQGRITLGFLLLVLGISGLIVFKRQRSLS